MMTRKSCNISLLFLHAGKEDIPYHSREPCHQLLDIPAGQRGRERTAGRLNPCAVIDPGDEGGRIIAFLDQHKFFPAYIILTHGHFDHIGGVSVLAKEYRSRYGGASRVIIAIHAADAEYLQPAADALLNEGDTIGPFTVLHLPGHTPGSIALWDKEAEVLFSGDTLFCGGYGRTDLPGGSAELLFASLTRLFNMNGDIQVFPGHDGTTTIGQEARDFQM